MDSIGVHQANGERRAACAMPERANVLTIRAPATRRQRNSFNADISLAGRRHVGGICIRRGLL
jgi:hypothetical protein